MVSAIKVDGRRLHELAREGKEVDRAPRPVHIERIEVESFAPGEYPTATLRVECGTGTYIRSLAADLGAALGGCAHLASLTRLRVGSFTLAEAASLEEIAGDPEAAVLTPLVAMRDLEQLPVDDDQAHAVAHGMAFPATIAAASGLGDGPFAVVGPEDELLAVYERRRAGDGTRRRAGRVGRLSVRVVTDLAGVRRSGRRGRWSPSARTTVSHLGHQAVLRLVRSSRPPVATRRVPHVRPAPRRGRATGVGAEAAHLARPEARADRRDR